MVRSLAFLWIVCGSSAFACTIPVFRFALDRWEADKFRLVMPAAMGKQTETARLLIPFRGNGPANLKIEESRDGAVAEAQLLDSRGGLQPLWSGNVDDATLGALLESPARRDLLKHLLSGVSVIWVIVDNGRPEGKAEVERVEKRLRYLEQVVALPEQDPTDPDSQLGPGPPLRLKFATLRVAMNDPAEKLFCAMLAGPKAADLPGKGVAFAAPVFGRGRVLGSFALAELDETALEDITMFLTGRCSCRVKNQSPGWDVLLKVDWESALLKAQKEQGSTSPGSGKARAVPEAVRIEPKKP